MSKGNLHYNYKLQVWVRGGYVEPCGHKDGEHKCAACELSGLSESEAMEEMGHV